jgi:hypothetical protein
MVKLSVCSTVFAGAEVSLTENVCEEVPCVVGVPLIPPVAASRLRPFGNTGETDHVYGGVPPELLTEAE